MLTRRNLMRSATAIAAMSQWPMRADAATPKNIVVMAKSIDNISTGSFDPAEAYDIGAWEILSNLYRTLVTVDADDPTKLVGDLAESWTMSPDGLEFTFELRKGLKFESGKPVTAEDAAFSLRRVVTLKKGPSFLLTQFGWTTGNSDKMISSRDGHTLVLRLPAVQAPGILLSCLSTPCGSVIDMAEVMAHAVNGDLGNAWLKTNSAGCGPYRLADWQPNDRITLDTNRNAASKPRVPRLVIRHVADAAAQLLLLRKGDADIARDLGSDQLKSIAGDADLAATSSSALYSMYMRMNMGLPQFKKPGVCQAIKWAIDYEAIARNITPNSWTISQSFLPKGMLGATDQVMFRKDVARAKTLLSEAGFPDGFSVTLDHYALWPHAEIAQAIQADLAAIGVKVSLLAGETKQVVTKVRGRQHQMAIMVWSPDYVDPHTNAQRFCANPDDGDSGALQTAAWQDHFIDRELTQAVSAAAQELDAGKRSEIYARMQREFMARSPYAFLLQRSSIAVERKGVSGLRLGVISNFTKFADIQKS